MRLLLVRRIGLAATAIASALTDLDGFKSYNDKYGHGAGDDLLRRIGARLERAVDGTGEAYRMGGDEFAVVHRPDAAPAAIAVALTEHGEGFNVKASYGTAILPDDAPDIETALHLADARMYERKFGRRGLATQDSADVLLAVLQEQSTTLSAHGDAVAELAAATGRELGLAAGQVDTIARAAQLHDVGKLAVPAAIVNKPGPLDADEWDFMRRHTLIGERILRAASSLSAVAQIVRSTHERWDGLGYPDGRAGEDIPLGARIVFACDAFDAMTERRPYREPVSPAAALAELEACAGTQFDPDVVCAVATVLQRQAEPALAHLV
jgi:diguanylate cyclase (GGDEF)-like protein